MNTTSTHRPKKSFLQKLTLACGTGLLLAASTVQAQSVQHIGKIWYILLENRNFTQQSGETYGEQIYGSVDAPYLNSLITPGNANAAQVSWCSAYHNVLAVYDGSGPSIHPSEPNYVWFENGSNLSILNDNDPYGSGLSVNSINTFLTANPAYTPQNLCALLQNASYTWKAYVEGTNQLNTLGNNINLGGTGNTTLTATAAPSSLWTVPLASFSGNNAAYTNPYNHSTQWDFAVKHTGSLFFPATNGTTSLTVANTSTTNTLSGNYPPMPQLASDLTNGTCARLNVITPDQFNDGHTGLAAAQHFTYNGVNYGTGGVNSADRSRVAQMDNFCAQVVPQIMASADYQNNGLIVIWTDETETSNGLQNDFKHTLLEIVISPLAKGNAYCSTLNYTHSSDLNTLQKIFQVTANSPSGFLNDAANPSNHTPESLVGVQTQQAAQTLLSGQASTPSGYGTGQAYDLSDLFQPGVIPATIPSVSITASSYVFNRRTNSLSQAVLVTNLLGTAITTPVYLATNNLSANTALINKAGLTANSTPTGSPYVVVSNAGLAAGASTVVVLQFTNPASGGISDNLGVFTTSGTP